MTKRQLIEHLEGRLEKYHRRTNMIPGAATGARRTALAGQLVKSSRRIEFVRVVATRDLSPLRADPDEEIFDAIRAAIIHRQNDDIEESAWLVFLATHFGKHRRYGFELTRRVYGRCGDDDAWTWRRTADDPKQFTHWLKDSIETVRCSPANAGFGNHRKYETLSDSSSRGTGRVIESYVRWVHENRSHRALFQRAEEAESLDRGSGFNALYCSMDDVVSFGRTARFDYLTMLSKVGVAQLEPRSLFIAGATGPRSGGRALFFEESGVRPTDKDIDAAALALGDYLGFGAQVMEDAICNWQKSPEIFKAFRG